MRIVKKAREYVCGKCGLLIRQKQRGAHEAVSRCLRCHASALASAEGAMKDQTCDCCGRCFENRNLTTCAPCLFFFAKHTTGFRAWVIRQLGAYYGRLFPENVYLTVISDRARV